MALWAGLVLTLAAPVALVLTSARHVRAHALQEVGSGEA